MVQHSQNRASNIPTRKAFDMTLNEAIINSAAPAMNDPNFKGDVVSLNNATTTDKPTNAFDLTSNNQSLIASGHATGIDGNSIIATTGHEQADEKNKKNGNKTARALQRITIQQQIDTLNLELSDVRKKIDFYQERLVEIAHQKVEVQHAVAETEKKIEKTEEELKQKQDELKAEKEALPEKKQAVKEAEQQLETAKATKSAIQNNSGFEDRFKSGGELAKNADTEIEKAELNLEEKKEIVLNSQMKIEILGREIEQQQETLTEEHEKLNALKEELTALEKEEEFIRAEKLPELEKREAGIVAKIDKLEQNIEQTNALHSQFENKYNTDEEFRNRVDGNDYTVQNFIEENLTKEQQVYAHNAIVDFVQGEKWDGFYQDHILRQAQQSDIGRNEHNDALVKAGLKEATDAPKMSYMHDGDTTGKFGSSAESGISSPVDTKIHFSNAVQATTPEALQQSPVPTSPAVTLVEQDTSFTAPGMGT